MLSFYFTYHRMSAKKSPSNIHPQDHDEFKRKLQAVHQELRHVAGWRPLSCCGGLLTTNSPLVKAAWLRNYEKRFGIGFTGKRLVRQCAWHATDDIQHVQHWSKKTGKWHTTFFGSEARKWIHNYYTNGEDRAIGKANPAI